jgi:hypothetical protein
VGLDLTNLCPGCGTAIGDHTIRGYSECLERAGFDYEIPHEDVPGGPVKLPGVTGDVVGEVVVRSAVMETRLGKVPLLIFDFAGAGPFPMSRRSLPPVNLVMDKRGLRAFAQLVAKSVESAIRAAG